MFIAFSPDDPSGEPFLPSDAERALLWAWRRLVVAGPGGQCAAVAVLLDRRFGDRGGDLHAWLRAAVMLLARHAVRRIVIAAPCALAVTPDETRLLLALRLAGWRLDPTGPLLPLAGSAGVALLTPVLDAMAALLAVAD